LRLKGLSDGTAYRIAAIAPQSRSVAQGLAPSILTGTSVIDGRVLAARGLELYLARPETSLLLHFVAA
jgi:hypothetical protein